MFIKSHELAYFNNGPSLSREETFSRRKQQNDAVLMKWVTRKKELVLKSGIGVLRKTLNELAQVKIVWDDEVTIPDGFLGKVHLDEVTVFHVDIDGYSQEVVVRKHTSGMVMFQFLDKSQGKIRINATGTFLLHRAFQRPSITFSSDDHSSYDLYEKAAICIMDHLINGKRKEKEKTLNVLLMETPCLIIPNVTEFVVTPKGSISLKELKLPYTRTLFKLLINGEAVRTVVSVLNAKDLFFEFVTVSDDFLEATNVATGIVTVSENEPVDTVIKLDDPMYSRINAKIAMMTVVGFIIASIGEDIIFTRHSTRKRDLIPVPPAIDKDGFNVVRYIVGTKSQNTEWQGGTHASPRQHTRRAHDRTLASGEVVRIPETVINQGTGGKIDKVYVPVKK